MKRGIARRRGRTFALAGVLALLVAWTAAPAAARPSSPPTVDLGFSALLAPDQGSISLGVLASCPTRWTVVEAVVTVRQAGGSGQASFPLTCNGSLQPFRVTVPATTGTFGLGATQADASVVIKRGKTQQATDSQALQVDPEVVVELADSARLLSGGTAVALEVTVACLAGMTGLPSNLNVSQSGLVSGNGTYTPICDGTRHTFSVRVEASQGTGVYQAGIAQALTFANVALGDEVFLGIDDDGALELVP
jgi:hypothetical protein